MPVVNVNNDNNVRPNSEIEVRRLVGGVVDEIVFVRSDSQGNFSHQTIFDQSLEGQQVEFIFTNTGTSEVASRFFTLPLLSDIPLTVIFPETIYTGDNNYGSYSVFPGVAVSGQITAPDNSVYSDLDREGSINASNLLNVIFPLGTAEGTYQVTLNASGYANPATASINVLWGFEAELDTPAGLRFPGQAHTISLKGKPGITVDITAFGSTNQITLDGNGDAMATITIPANAAFELEIATITVPDFPFPVSLGLRVDDPDDYVLSASIPSALVTNGQGNASVLGLALPGKTITLNIPELNYTNTAIADAFGTYEITISAFPWQPSGTFIASVSAPDEVTINGSGTHKPQIEIISQPTEVRQGSPSQTFEVRGDANDQVVVSINGQPATYNTDANGLATAIFPEIPLLIAVPFSISVIVSHPEPPALSRSFEITVDSRVPLSVVIADSETIGESSNLLLINTTYTITGQAPGESLDSSELSLSGIGNLAGQIVVTSHENDQYEATLTTGGEPSALTITATTFNQPGTSVDYQIVHPLDLDIPQGSINFDDPEFTVTATTSPAVVVTLRYSYTNDSDAVLEAQELTLTADAQGIATFTIDPLNVNFASRIDFQAFNSTAFVREESRGYQSEISNILPLPAQADILGVFPFAIAAANIIKNQIADSPYEFFLVASGNSTVTLSPSSSLYSEGFKTGDDRFATFSNNRSFTLDTVGTDTAWMTQRNGFTWLGQWIDGTLQGAGRTVPIEFPGFQLVRRDDLIYELILDDNVGQVAGTQPITLNTLLNLCLRVIIQNPDNSDNTTFSFYLNGELYLELNLDSVWSPPASFAFFCRTINKAISGNLLKGGTDVLYGRPLTDTEILECYSREGIQKKLRLGDPLDRGVNSVCLAPRKDSPLRGFYIVNNVIAEPLRVVTEWPENASNRAGAYLNSNEQIQVDNLGRPYYLFDGTNNIITSLQGARNISFVIQRGLINTRKQVLFDLRGGANTFSYGEVFFNGIDTLRVIAQVSTFATMDITYQHPLLATNEVLCCDLRVSSSISGNRLEINDNRAALTRNTPEIPPNFNEIGGTYAIGSKFEGTDYFQGRVYCLLPDTLGALNFFRIGFPEAMQRQFSTSDLLSFAGGRYYI